MHALDPASRHIELIIKQNHIIHIDDQISSLQDMLNLIDKYPLHTNMTYNIDMKTLHNIKEPLRQLSEMVGIKDIKNKLSDIRFSVIHGDANNFNIVVSKTYCV